VRDTKKKESEWERKEVEKERLKKEERWWEG
jgi:hypothetical protein